MKIIWEIRLLALVCLVDLISTVWLLKTGNAVEANPIMEFYLEHGGTVCFIIVKAFLFLGPLYILEQIRKKRPVFMRMLFRSFLVAYVLLYGFGSWYANSAHDLPTLQQANSVAVAGFEG